MNILLILLICSIPAFFVWKWLFYEAVPRGEFQCRYKIYYQTMEQKRIFKITADDDEVAMFEITRILKHGATIIQVLAFENNKLIDKGMADDFFNIPKIRRKLKYH